ncbi:MAG: glutathione S-transferase [Rhizobiales bacterium]|nr:glutathione S-transferase [Hyphomicrobiales bacterium]
MSLRLIIGNKNYSSWSLRPWFAMTVAGIPFEEEVVPLHTPEFKPRLSALSPAGRVPVLIDGDVHVWESLAILEYVNEKFPQARLWPDEPSARAHARVVANEMHAGFVPLRRACPMNVWRPVTTPELAADVQANVARIDAMWSDCRARFGAGGPFLFGAFCAADAMYAPVVSRFRTYGIAVGPASCAYMEAILGLAAWGAWREAAVKEPWVLAEDEPDWPTVLRE